MSCFWNSINKALGRGWNPNQLLDWYKKINRMPHRVTVNGDFLSYRQRAENFQWVQDYSIQDGHLTGSADAFFILLCDVERCNIIHHTPHCKIVYSTTSSSAGPTYVFRSSSSHIDHVETSK